MRRYGSGTSALAEAAGPRTAWRRRLVILVGAVLVSLTVAVGDALADAGNPILNTIGATAVDNGNETVTISVRGQWVWTSHSKDCNVDRAATGVGIIWNDPTEPGYLVSKTKGGVTVSAEVGISKLRPGSTNTIDRMVHPVDRGNVPEGYVVPGADFPADQEVVDPSPPDPAGFASWKGGCGRTPMTETASKGGHPERTGLTCASGTLECDERPWGSWGYERTYAHTYLKTALPSQICANFYDVHGGGAVGTDDFQAVKSAKEITVDENGDNSIQTNTFNVNQGANCISTPTGTIELKKVFVGGPAGARANLSIVQGGTAMVVGSKANAASGEGTGVLTVLAGSYTISELAGSDTTLVDYTSEVSCDGGQVSGVSGDKRSASVAVSANANVVCTFVNTFVKKSPTIATNAGGPYRVDANGQAHLTDAATLTGATSDATGTVTFTLYGPDPTPGEITADDCSAGKQVGVATATVSGGVAGPSAPALAVGRGTYHWVASYSGDGSNNPVSGACGAENENPLVFDPSVAITKLTSTPVVLKGGTATFSIRVENTGDIALTNVTVTDALTPGCARSLGTMAAGAVVTYSCTRAEVAADFTNSATATGQPPVGPPVTATSTVPVDVIEPRISIEKGPNGQTVASGSTVTFTITVTNTGDVKLTGVVVSDAQAPGCARSLGDLSPAAVVSYTCTLANVTSSLTNVAVVTGKPPVGPDVTSSNDAKVTVEAPLPPPAPKADVAIEKDATAQVVLGADGRGTIAYRIRVQSNGPDAAAEVTVTDTAPDGVTFASITTQPAQGSCVIENAGRLLRCSVGTLSAGTAVVIEVSAVVTVTGTVTNTAATATTTEEPNRGNNTDSAQTLVVAPITPPVPPPSPPKPPPKPPDLCTVVGKPLVVSGTGKVQRITVTVKRGKKGVAGATVRVTGPGISKTVKTGRNGTVVVTVRPSGPGIIRITVVKKKACNTLRIGVVGTYRPPLTG